jgi:TolA-binding protein
MADLEKRVREQTDELQKLRTQLETLTYTLDSMGKRMGMGGATGSLGASGSENPFAPGPAGTPGTAPATASGTETMSAGNAGEALTRALNQFNLGNFIQARQGFEQALQMNPTLDQKAESLFFLAESCYNLKDLEPAEKYYKDVISAKNTDPKAWVSLERVANINIEKGEPQDLDYAKVLLEQITGVFPQYKYPDIERVRQTLEQINQRLSGGAAPGVAVQP